MERKHNKKLVPLAKSLRKNMTKEERHLWYDFLKTLPIIVNRQKVIGNYIVDFYCHQAKLVVELDGSQHFSKENQEKDWLRTAYLESLGLKVLRFSNLDIHRRFRSVCEMIDLTVKERAANHSSDCKE